VNKLLILTSKDLSRMPNDLSFIVLKGCKNSLFLINNLLGDSRIQAKSFLYNSIIMLFTDSCNSKIKLPDFLLIGAGKSGTTSIDKYLKAHPQIFMPPKEPCYFAFSGLSDTQLNQIQDLKYNFPRSVLTLKDYTKLFASSQEGQILGETSPIYFHNENAPLQIYKFIPDVKLVVILRQPVDRLYSRFLHLAGEGRPPTESFKEVINKNSIWWTRDDLIQEGFYFTNLSRYIGLFPHANIKIVFYDDFVSNPQELMKEIYDFLNVSTNFIPDTTVIYNQSGFVRNQFYDFIIGKSSPVKATIEKITPGFYDKMRNNISVRKLINKMRQLNLNRPPLDPKLKSEITHLIYKEEIIKLQDLVKRDLSKWLI